jgi:AraC-like DNA-binding protein
MHLKNIFNHTRQWRIQILKKLAAEFQIINMPLTSMDERFISKALDIIARESSDPDFGPEECARLMAFSRAHLNRKLKGLTGQRTNEFIRTMRLHKAAELLRQRAGTVSEVAYQVGFNHLSYFARIFKEQYGYSPSEYAESSRSD